ncbi:hypothetical protein [Oceanobacillus saliphilus]|uniref:hypothetical protein n=1 Tax=Oceanobacillus saliphilus TaxID=2925834 RepID=UPI00201E1873|nr:hypothetical protein [Oceanobacillus saliphilus]
MLSNHENNSVEPFAHQSESEYTDQSDFPAERQFQQAYFDPAFYPYPRPRPRPRPFYPFFPPFYFPFYYYPYPYFPYPYYPGY